jgi:ABC-type spermidine/putrescine transport system permease subunit I
MMLGLGLLIPLGNMGLLSVFHYVPQTIWEPTLTLENYARLADPHYRTIVLRTLRVGAVTTVIALVLAVPLAYWLARCSRALLAIGLFLIVMPMMVSTVIRAFGWMIVLGRNGIINSLSVEIGIGRWLFIMNTEPAVIIALVQLVLPLTVLPLLAAMEKIPLALEEVATSLGAGPVQLFRRVLLPLSVPGLVSGALLAFVVSISVVVTPALMGGRENRMFGNEIYDQVITAINWPFAASLSVALVALILIILSGALLAVRRIAAGPAGGRG